MTNQHPIAPPPELVEKWIREANHNEPMFAQVAVMGAQWGADQELESCCSEVQNMYSGGSRLRAKRRPALSLKKQALLALDLLISGSVCSNSVTAESTIRRALEALDG